MPVSFDVATSTSGSGVSGALSINITVGSGTNEALVLWANFDNNVSDSLDPVRVTCDGTPMTLIPNTDTLNQSGVELTFRTLGFVTTGLASGLHALHLTSAAAQTPFITLIAASFFGVDPIYPIRQAQATSIVHSATETPSLSIITQAGDMTCDAVADNNFAPGSPTQTSPANGVSGGFGISYALASSNLNTHAWSYGAGNTTICTQSGVSLRAKTNAIGYPLGTVFL